MSVDLAPLDAAGRARATARGSSKVKAAEPTADGFLVVVAARTFQGARSL